MYVCRPSLVPREWLTIQEQAAVRTRSFRDVFHGPLTHDGESRTAATERFRAAHRVNAGHGRETAAAA